MRIIDNDDFFCTFCDIPFKNTENSYQHFEAQLRAHVLDELAARRASQRSKAQKILV